MLNQKTTQELWELLKRFDMMGGDHFEMEMLIQDELADRELERDSFHTSHTGSTGLLMAAGVDVSDRLK